MNAVGLFAGIGGFELALHRAGIHTVAAVEIDPNCRKVLARHFPNTALFDDVRRVTGDQLRTVGFDGGILTGGFPCQDLSIAGSREGLAGGKSGLFHHIPRIIDETQPRFVFLENVPGLLNSNGGRDMATVVGELAKRGYGVAWRVLDAAFFGVPQRRQRVFIVGCFGDRRAPVEILFEPESSSGLRVKTATQQNRDASGGALGTLTAKCSLQPACLILTEHGPRDTTPVERERLQGFPDGWTAGHSDAARWRMTGNAVAVPVVEWIANRIAGYQTVQVAA